MIDIEKKSLKGYSFIDLFAGLGGFRIALESLGASCVYSSEWDIPVQKVYANNFGNIPEKELQLHFQHMVEAQLHFQHMVEAFFQKRVVI